MKNDIIENAIAAEAYDLLFKSVCLFVAMEMKDTGFSSGPWLMSRAQAIWPTWEYHQKVFKKLSQHENIGPRLKTLKLDADKLISEKTYKAINAAIHALSNDDSLVLVEGTIAFDSVFKMLKKSAIELAKARITSKEWPSDKELRPLVADISVEKQGYPTDWIHQWGCLIILLLVLGTVVACTYWAYWKP